MGGPIWKNKIFFFFNYETVREPFSPVQGNGWYDTPAFAALAPAGSIAAQYLSFPGNGVVGTINPNATCATAGLSEGVNCVTIPGQGINVGSPLTTPLGTQDLTWSSTTSPGVGAAWVQWLISRTTTSSIRLSLLPSNTMVASMPMSLRKITWLSQSIGFL